MISFTEARAAVERELAPTWTNGALATSREGLEDDLGYVVVYGRREWIEHGDLRFLQLDPPVAMVDRQSGVVDFMSQQDALARVDAMGDVAE